MIELFNGYYIKAADYGYALCRGDAPNRMKKNGKKSVDHNIKGYYGSVGKALQAFRQELVHDYVESANPSLSEAIRAIREINDKVDRQMEELKGV